MSIIVEHEKRRREILEKALDVFLEEGFEDVTFQKLADRCGITRTTLYIYFKNKKEIFNLSTKQLLKTVENDITRIGKEKNLSHREKLTKVMITIIEHIEKNLRLLWVVLNYVLYISKSASNPDYHLRRRTVRVRHILANMIIEGKKSGEFARSINVKNADALLYSFLEAAAFRLVVLRRTSVDELKEVIRLAVQGFTAEETNGAR